VVEILKNINNSSNQPNFYPQMKRGETGLEITLGVITPSGRGSEGHGCASSSLQQLLTLRIIPIQNRSISNRTALQNTSNFEGNRK